MGEYNKKPEYQLIPKKKIYLKDPHENYKRLQFPNFYEKIKLAYDIYETSDACLNLASEQNCKLNSDRFYFEEDYNNIRKLSNIVIDFLVNYYTGKRNYDATFDEYSKIKFWNKVDLNLPFPKVIHIESDIYWKRYYSKTIMNYKKNISLERLYNNQEYNWKEIGISLKLSNYIENADYGEWFEEKEEKLMELIAPWVKNLNITRLKPMSFFKFERDFNLSSYPIKHFNPEDWYHINLKVISKLYNLTQLSISFSPPELGINYESRMFYFSTQDIQNLAAGLEYLQKLKVLHFDRSDWNSNKLMKLIPKLTNIPIEDIQFKYCNLENDCANMLAEILRQNSFLKHLRLTGNKITGIGMSALSQAIQEFKGQLITLDISRNPIYDNGLLYLGRALQNSSNQIKNLNISAIEITQEGGLLISEILKHHNLIYANMMALPIGEEAGNYLIKGLVQNRTILDLDIRYCELSHEQEVMIKVLIDRNNYIYNNPYIGKRDEYKLNTNFPDEWVNRIKNPILLKALSDLENKARLEQTLKNKATQLPKNFPKFIPIDVRVQKDSQDYVIPDLSNQRLKKSKRKKSIMFNLEFSTKEKEEDVSEPPKPETFSKENFFKYFGNPCVKENVKNYFL